MGKELIRMSEEEFFEGLPVSRVGPGQGWSKHMQALGTEICYRHDNSRGVTDFTRGRARSSSIVAGGVGVSVSRKMTFLPPSFS
jgi:hypothetical protein